MYQINQNQQPQDGSLPALTPAQRHQVTFEEICKVIPLGQSARFPRHEDLPGASLRHIHPEKSKVDWIVFSISKHDCPHEQVRDEKWWLIEGRLNEKGDFWVNTLPNPDRAPYDNFDDLTKELITKAVENLVYSAKQGLVKYETVIQPAPPPTPEEAAEHRRISNEIGPIRGWRPGAE